ncbi:copper insertion chaperone and transporter component [[Clostridium] ultunense Esp]|uniref:heavy-metal-associated domain-containing protein n=1 Tax=Schnuerera ultunensis TaxID=45497 RepID=UPI0002B6FCBC|nr:copper ion binding protein [Schnuerera ultunensis]CCQ98057.1 copper insertion chaperone and transporter component [[Clostridium] ultunense Esp]
MKKILLVEGMSCNHCVMAVTNALKELKGVSNVDVNLESKKVEVIGDNLTEENLKKAVEEAGYDVVEIN